MNYIITKQTPRNEWRIYIDGEIENEVIIYKGHKLGVEFKHLFECLEYRQEKSSGKYYFLNYEKLETTPDTKNTEMWFDGNVATLERIVDQSWSTLQIKLKKEFGDFRKIILTKVNI